MDEEEPEGVAVGAQFLGEGEGLSHEARHALAQGEVEAFDVVGLALLLGTRLMLLGGHDTVVGVIEVG